MNNITKNLTSDAKTKPLNHTRNLPSNLYLEYIKDFESLSLDEQEYIWHRIYLLYLSCFSLIDYEELKNNLLNIQKKQIKILILKEKRFGTDVGADILFLDEIYYKENDESVENKYLFSFHITMLAKHYRGEYIGKILVLLVDQFLIEELSSYNLLSFNRVLNSYFYEYMSHVSSLVFPGPDQGSSNDLEILLRKIMKKVKAKRINEEKPFVEEFGVSINSSDYERYRNEKRGKSKARDFFYEQTGFVGGRVLLALAVGNLIEGNTLERKPGPYLIKSNIARMDIEVREYKPKFTNRL